MDNYILGGSLILILTFVLVAFGANRGLLTFISVVAQLFWFIHAGGGFKGASGDLMPTLFYGLFMMIPVGFITLIATLIASVINARLANGRSTR